MGAKRGIESAGADAAQICQAYGSFFSVTKLVANIPDIFAPVAIKNETKKIGPPHIARARARAGVSCVVPIGVPPVEGTIKDY